MERSGAPEYGKYVRDHYAAALTGTSPMSNASRSDPSTAKIPYVPLYNGGRKNPRLGAMLGPMPVAVFRVWEVDPSLTLVSPAVAALVAGVVLGAFLLLRRSRTRHLESAQAPHVGMNALDAYGSAAKAPAQPLVTPAAHVGAVLSRLDEALSPLLGEAVSLDVLNASAGRPLLAPDRLEQVLVQLALTVRDGMDGGIVTMRAYDGLGDVTRGDGRRTWTIIEVGKVDAPSHMPPVSRVSASNEQGMQQVRQMVDEVGGRLALEQRVPGNPYFVLQLPSIAA